MKDSANGDRANILLVDDIESNLSALRAILEGVDANLVTAGCGAEALSKLLDTRFALVLLDIQMPEIDGFETAKLIRERAKTRSLPIIFLTAYDHSGALAARGYELGAVDYLIKPVVPEILLSKVRVFVELYDRAEKLKEQQTRERAQATRLYQHFRAIAERNPEGAPEPVWLNASRLAKLREEYREIVHSYVQAVRILWDRPSERVRRFADSLAKVQIGASELIKLHLDVLRLSSRTQSPVEERVFGNDARLFPVELMGYLLDSHRAVFQEPLSVHLDEADSRVEDEHFNGNQI